MSNLESKDPFQLCRCCLERISYDDYFSIEDESIKSLMYQCFSIQLHSYYLLPDKICGNCFDTLKSFNSFKEKFFANEESLKNLSMINKSCHLSDKDVENYLKGDKNERELNKVTLFEQSVKEESWIDGNQENERNEDNKQFRVIAEFEVINNEIISHNSVEGPIIKYESVLSENTLDLMDTNYELTNDEIPYTDEVTVENSSKLTENAETNLTDFAVPYCCNKCSKEFVSKLKLKEHILKFHAPEQYKCRFKLNGKKCPSILTQLDYYIQHVRKKHKIDRTIECQKCTPRNRCKFYLEEQLERHNMIVHSRKLDGNCQICGKYVKYLRTHQTVIHNVKNIKPYTCKQCKDTKFDNHKDYVKHREREHTTVYYCKWCERSSLPPHRKSWLKKHELVCKFKDIDKQDIKIDDENNPILVNDHPIKDEIEEKKTSIDNKQNQMKEEYLICGVCKMQFSSLKGVRIHEARNHPDSKPIRCRICGKAFETEDLQEAHEKTHDIACYNCDVKTNGIICGAKFNLLVSFKKHLKFEHQLEKTVKCVVEGCEKLFLVEAEVRTHIHQKHKGVQIEALLEKLECPLCKRKVFALDDHLRVIHGLFRSKGTTTFKCKRCSKVFKSYMDRSRHQIEEHNVRSKKLCPICGIYLQDNTLAKHVLTHRKSQENKRSYKCPECGNGYNTIEHLRLHVRNVHTLQTCPICKKEMKYLNIKHHMLKHENRPSYRCSQCGSRFLQLESYQKHMVRHEGKTPPSCLNCGKTFSNPRNVRRHQEKTACREFLAKLVSVNDSD